jgi:ribosome-associated heat shock protein Hsp15
MARMMAPDDLQQGLRIDKWLWAARLFKTRGLALAAIKGGKVHVDGERVKPSRLIRPGDRLDITLSRQAMTIIVNDLNAQRRPAREAQRLYTETAESRARRESQAEQRRLLNAAMPHTQGRPDKHQRRQIRRFTGKE